MSDHEESLDDSLRVEALSGSRVPRRAVLTGASGLILAGFVRGAAAAAQPVGAANPSLVATALHCSGTGEICLEHCLKEFTRGDTMLAKCAARVAEMVPVCKGLASLAALESEHLPAYAKVCIDVCKSCEVECRKHEAHHEICKECADACAKVIEACRKVG